jgi:hypothetical protein
MEIKPCKVKLGLALGLLSALLIPGCSPSNPVQMITVFAGPLVGMPPRDGSMGLPITVTKPFPEETHRYIRQVFSPDEKLSLVLQLDKRFMGNISFSKITLFNKDTAQETELSGTTPEAGSFVRGSLVTVWSGDLLSEPGTYEIRVYYEGKKVAATQLEVK